MKVLVIGSGGREHAMAWCLAKSPRVTRVYVAPGNGGTARAGRPDQSASQALAPIENVPLDPVNSPQSVAELVKTQGVALTVVGPEAPLAAGIGDTFRKEGLPIFGPVAAAA